MYVFVRMYMYVCKSKCQFIGDLNHQPSSVCMYVGTVCMSINIVEE